MREAHVCAISSHIQSLKQLAKGKDGKNYLQTIYTDDAQIYIYIYAPCFCTILSLISLILLAQFLQIDLQNIP